MALEASISTWLEAFNHLWKGFDESLVCGTFEGVLDVLVYVNDIQNHQLRQRIDCDITLTLMFFTDSLSDGPLSMTSVSNCLHVEQHSCPLMKMGPRPGQYPAPSVVFGGMFQSFNWRSRCFSTSVSGLKYETRRPSIMLAGWFIMVAISRPLAESSISPIFTLSPDIEVAMKLGDTREP
jgi:hypothetical protein